MAFGATVLSLEKVIEITEILEKKAIQHAAEKVNDPVELEARQKYRDYQMSLVYYLKQLKK